MLAGELAAGGGHPGEVLDDRLTIACGEGALRLTRLQRPGGKPMAADAFLRGFHLPVGRPARHAMPRYKLTLEYDGGPFRGWQRQSGGESVQQALEEAVRKFCGEDVQVVGAGRTDAGVHATGQVAHLDLSRRRHPRDAA